ncbi:hypothetical protein Pfo_022500 [Paulownia fortunei]|nr:hypothetical protein Pfo_022500 [Paulownia fortunei]
MQGKGNFVKENVADAGGIDNPIVILDSNPSSETTEQRFFRTNGFLHYKTGFYVYDVDNVVVVDFDNEVGHIVNAHVIILDDSNLKNDNDTSDEDDEEETSDDGDGTGYVDGIVEE